MRRLRGAKRTRRNGRKRWMKGKDARGARDAKRADEEHVRLQRFADRVGDAILTL